MRPLLESSLPPARHLLHSIRLEWQKCSSLYPNNPPLSSSYLSACLPPVAGRRGLLFLGCAGCMSDSRAFRFAASYDCPLRLGPNGHQQLWRHASTRYGHARNGYSFLTYSTYSYTSLYAYLHVYLPTYIPTCMLTFMRIHGPPIPRIQRGWGRALDS